MAEAKRHNFTQAYLDKLPNAEKYNFAVDEKNNPIIGFDDNLKLIEIEYDELKDNTQRLRSSIKSKINCYRNEILDKIKN